MTISSLAKWMVTLLALFYLLLHLKTLRPFLQAVENGYLRGTMALPVILLVILLLIAGRLSIGQLLLAMLAALLSICVLADAVFIYSLWPSSESSVQIILNSGFVFMSLAIGLLLAGLITRLDQSVILLSCIFHFVLHAVALKHQFGSDYQSLSWANLSLWTALLAAPLFIISNRLMARFRS